MSLLPPRFLCLGAFTLALLTTTGRALSQDPHLPPPRAFRRWANSSASTMSCCGLSSTRRWSHRLPVTGRQISRRSGSA